MSILDEAMKLALKAHFGHANEHDGEPYVLHLHRVWRLVEEAGGNEEQQAIAWLHDSLEDTELTLEEIKQACGSRVALGVDFMTKRRGESNEAYYHRVVMNKDATLVKRCDLHENFRRNHLIEDDDKRLRMGKKYSLGFDILGR